MSNIYIQEPPTNGKVLLKTTAGDIDIELWSKEAPKACRNFIQLCMEDYYSNTIFHRVVPGFIVQGGDPTGTGSGGESVYGAPFKDEFHSRLRFNRRGLVAMANAGPHDNGSQFFFTLGRADELNSKHTIFGKITGDTIYNMLRLAEVETDNDERPVNPHKIRSTEVLFNPFDDIIPRTSKKLKYDKTVEEVKKAKSKGTKNFSLLSFGEEAEEEEEEVSKVSQSMKGKSKSSHDLLKDDPHLSSVPAIESEKAGDSHNSDEEEEKYEYSGEDDDLDSDEKHQMKERIAQKLKKDTNLPVKKSTTEEEMEKKSSRRVATLEGDAGGQPRDESSEGQVQGGSGRHQDAASGSAPWGLSEGTGEDLMEEMEEVYGVWDERKNAPLPAKRPAIRSPSWQPGWIGPWSSFGPYGRYPYDGRWFQNWYNPWPRSHGRETWD